MKLDVKAMAISLALVWGVLGMFLTGAANAVWPTYGQEFLQVMASVYPGYKGTPGFGQALVAAIYGLVDAAIVGAVFAWIYNACVTRIAKPEAR